MRRRSRTIPRRAPGSWPSWPARVEPIARRNRRRSDDRGESRLKAMDEGGGDVRAVVMTSWSDRVVFGGLVALVAAATMSGLTRDVTIWGREFTIRPDQVVLLALLPAIAAALVRRGRVRRFAALHLPVLAFLRRQRARVGRRLHRARREPAGHGAHGRLRGHV